MSETGRADARTAEPIILPAHIEVTVQAIARLHATHRASATPLQRLVERLTARAGRPAFVALLTVVVVAWMTLNVVLVAVGRTPLDAPPFFWLQGAVALTALYMTVLILTTQRREDEFTALREQLTLELAILSEQKSAKIIALLEELRRDHPQIHDRDDAEAQALSTPADPNAVLEAIQQTHAVLSQTDSVTSVDEILPSDGPGGNTAGAS